MIRMAAGRYVRFVLKPWPILVTSPTKGRKGRHRPVRLCSLQIMSSAASWRALMEGAASSLPPAASAPPSPSSSSSSEGWVAQRSSSSFSAFTCSNAAALCQSKKSVGKAAARSGGTFDGTKAPPSAPSCRCCPVKPKSATGIFLLCWSAFSTCAGVTSRERSCSVKVTAFLTRFSRNTFVTLRSSSSTPPLSFSTPARAPSAPKAKPSSSSLLLAGSSPTNRKSPPFSASPSPPSPPVQISSSFFHF
mmetsp:Transcript_21332/g.68841  ORF Transcript_21332/g.68841 Transcript_21332/m.68841 type:complete len:248 (-) Transcript_21332:1267-2010(-)